jgi:hypothetical protein
LARAGLAGSPAAIPLALSALVSAVPAGAAVLAGRPAAAATGSRAPAGCTPAGWDDDLRMLWMILSTEPASLAYVALMDIPGRWMAA